MKLKTLAHAAQQHLQATCDASLRRSHIHELVAAAFGFGSWAALRADGFLADAGLGESPGHHAGIAGRAIQLGYPATIASQLSAHLQPFLETQGVRAMRRGALSKMLEDLRAASHRLLSEVDDEDWAEHDGEDRPWQDVGARSHPHVDRPHDGGISASSMLLEELAAAQLDPMLHFSLAQVLRCRTPNPYLYEESLKGRELSAAERGWVSAYLADVPRHAAYEHHLRAAAIGGVRQAAATYARYFDRPEFFDLAQRQAGDVDPMQMAQLAPTPQARMSWLRKAAEGGSEHALALLSDEDDPWAMEQLARRGDSAALRGLARSLCESGDALRAWALQYVALGRGQDLSRDDYHAYHDGGSHAGELYDDDVGGPLYADGEDAVLLPALGPEAHRRAKQLARRFAQGVSLVSDDEEFPAGAGGDS